MSGFMDDNTTKKVSHTTNNKDRGILLLDVEMEIGG